MYIIPSERKSSQVHEKRGQTASERIRFVVVPFDRDIHSEDFWRQSEDSEERK
jgi:hypothetical protein